MVYFSSEMEKDCRSGRSAQGVLTCGSASCRNFLTKCASGVRNFKFVTEKISNLKFLANKNFYKAKMAEEEHNMLDGLNLSNNRHI